MDNLWKSKFNEIIKNSEETPRDIVQQQCVELSELTKGTIIARISEYDGEVKSYSRSHNFFINPIKNFDVQEALGEIHNDEAFKYEFFITSKATPKYKFRAFFLYYGISMYPATFVIESEIAAQIGVESEVSIANKDEFIELLSKILNSEHLMGIIHKLLLLN